MTIPLALLGLWFALGSLHAVGQLPARLTAEQAAWVLNCQPHDVPSLVAAHLLKPLGNPPANNIKFFATADVLELVKDRAWLTKVTNTINQHWHRRNSRNEGRPVSGSQNGPSPLLDLPLAAH
jgi:hypothetical protein